MYIHTDTPNLAPEVPAKDSMQHARLRGAAVRRGAELERLCVCVCVCVRVYVCVYMNIWYNIGRNSHVSAPRAVSLYDRKKMEKKSVPHE